MIMFPQHCKTIIWCTVYMISLSLRRKCPLKGTKRQLWILYVYFTVVPSVWAALLSADFITSLIGFPLLSASFFFCTANWLTLPWIIWFGYSTSQDKLLIMMIADIGLLITVSHCCGWVNFVADREAYIKAWITKSYQTTLNHLSPKTLQSELRWRATEGNAKNLSSK